MSFEVILPDKPQVPVLLSLPHSGTVFPPEIARIVDPEVLRFPDDTDWHLDKLYGFASDLGITTIMARESRYVIDLNRQTDSAPLYHDGRMITSLVPRETFNRKMIYLSYPSREEIAERIIRYYKPYYTRVVELLNDLSSRFGSVLFFDGHSIRRQVSSIQEAPFPDLILGDNQEETASAELIATAMSVLGKSGLQVHHNHPFRGGNLTRHFGRPSDNIHALQLEMSKDLYMDDAEVNYHPERAVVVQEVLKELFTALIAVL